MGKILILLFILGIIVVDFISYINKNNEKEVEEPISDLDKGLFRFYESKGWSNIGYDEDHNLIGNHPEYGNGELIQEYK
jgi:hypothetical protein